MPRSYALYPQKQTVTSNPLNQISFDPSNIANTASDYLTLPTPEELFQTVIDDVNKWLSTVENDIPELMEQIINTLLTWLDDVTGLDFLSWAQSLEQLFGQSSSSGSGGTNWLQALMDLIFGTSTQATTSSTYWSMLLNSLGLGNTGVLGLSGIISTGSTNWNTLLNDLGLQNVSGLSAYLNAQQSINDQSAADWQTLFTELGQGDANALSEFFNTTNQLAQQSQNNWNQFLNAVGIGPAQVETSINNLLATLGLPNLATIEFDVEAAWDDLFAPVTKALTGAAGTLSDLEVWAENAGGDISALVTAIWDGITGQPGGSVAQIQTALNNLMQVLFENPFTSQTQVVPNAVPSLSLTNWLGSIDASVVTGLVENLHGLFFGSGGHGALTATARILRIALTGLASGHGLLAVSVNFIKEVTVPAQNPDIFGKGVLTIVATMHRIIEPPAFLSSHGQLTARVPEEIWQSFVYGFTETVNVDIFGSGVLKATVTAKKFTLTCNIAGAGLFVGRVSQSGFITQTQLWSEALYPDIFGHGALTAAAQIHKVTCLAAGHGSLTAQVPEYVTTSFVLGGVEAIYLDVFGRGVLTASAQIHKITAPVSGRGSLTGIVPGYVTISFVLGEVVNVGLDIFGRGVLTSVTQGFVTFDTVGAGTTGTGQNLSYQHTINGNAIIGFYNAGAVTPTQTMSVGGVPMTQVASINYTTNVWIRVFALLNPPTGTQTITGHSTTGNAFAINTVSYNNVSSFGTPVTNTATGGPNLTVESVIGQMIAAGFSDTNANFSAFNKTQRYSVNVVGGVNWPMLIGDASATAGSYESTSVNARLAGAGVLMASTQIVGTSIVKVPYSMSAAIPPYGHGVLSATAYPVVRITATDAGIWGGVAVPLNPIPAPSSVQVAQFELAGAPSGHGALTARIPDYVSTAFILGVVEYVYIDQFGHGTLSATATVKLFRLAPQIAGSGVLRGTVQESQTISWTTVIGLTETVYPLIHGAGVLKATAQIHKVTSLNAGQGVLTAVVPEYVTTSFVVGVKENVYLDIFGSGVLTAAAKIHKVTGQTSGQGVLTAIVPEYVTISFVLGEVATINLDIFGRGVLTSVTQGSVTFDTAGAGFGGVTGSPSYQHTINGNAIVGFYLTAANRTTTLSVGAVPMTQVGTVANFIGTLQLTVFTLLNPPTGVQTVTGSSISVNTAVNTVSYSNVQSFGAANVISGTTTKKSMTAESVVGQLVAQAFGGNQSFTGYNETERFILPLNVGSNEALVIGDAAAVAGNFEGMSPTLISALGSRPTLPNTIFSKGFLAASVFSSTATSIGGVSGAKAGVEFTASRGAYGTGVLLATAYPVLTFSFTGGSNWGGVAVPLNPIPAPSSAQVAQFELTGAVSGNGALTAKVPDYVSISFILGVKEFVYVDQFGSGVLAPRVPITYTPKPHVFAVGQGLLRGTVQESQTISWTTVIGLTETVYPQLAGNGALTSRDTHIHKVTALNVGSGQLTAVVPEYVTTSFVVGVKENVYIDIFGTGALVSRDTHIKKVTGQTSGQGVLTAIVPEYVTLSFVLGEVANINLDLYGRGVLTSVTQGSVTFDTHGVGYTGTSKTPSYQHTINGDAIVGFYQAFSNPTTVTLSVGGVPMTQIASVLTYATSSNIFVFALLNPPTGAQTISGTSTVGSQFTVNTVAYNNVASFGSPVTDNGNGGPNIEAQSVVGQMIAQVFSGNTTNFTAYNKTQRYNVPFVSGNNLSMVIGDTSGVVGNFVSTNVNGNLLGNGSLAASVRSSTATHIGGKTVSGLAAGVTTQPSGQGVLAATAYPVLKFTAICPGAWAGVVVPMNPQAVASSAQVAQFELTGAVSGNGALTGITPQYTTISFILGVKEFIYIDQFGNGTLISRATSVKLFRVAPQLAGHGVLANAVQEAQQISWSNVYGEIVAIHEFVYGQGALTALVTSHQFKETIALSGNGKLVVKVPDVTTFSFVHGVQWNILLTIFGTGATTPGTYNTNAFKISRVGSAAAPIHGFFTGAGLINANVPDVISASFVIGQKFGVTGYLSGNGVLIRNVATQANNKINIGKWPFSGKGSLAPTNNTVVPFVSYWDLAYSQLVAFLTTGNFTDLTTAWNDLVAAVENSFTGTGGTATFFSGIVTTINNALASLLPAAWDNADGTAAVQAGATITQHSDGTSSYSSPLGTNPLLSLIDGLDGTTTTPATALQNFHAPATGSVPAKANLAQEIVDYINQSLSGDASSKGLPISSVSTNLSAIPNNNVLAITAATGSPGLGGSLQATLDQLWQALTGGTNTGNSLATLGNATASTSATATNAQSVAQSATTAIANRATSKPGYLAIDASADSVFPLSQMSGSSASFVTISNTTAVIGYIGTPDSGVKQTIMWLGQTTAGITAMFLTVYSVNTSTGALTKLFTSADISGAVFNTLAWNYYDIPSANFITSAQGNWYAVEMMTEGPTSGYQIAGIPNHWLPANTTATTFPQSLGGQRTAMLAPVFSAAGSNTTGTGTSPFTQTMSFSAVSGASVFVFIGVYASGTPVSGLTATYGGVSMTLMGSVSPFNTSAEGLTSAFALLNSGTGSAQTVSVTATAASANVTLVMNAVSYTNVGSVGAIQSANGDSSSLSKTGISNGAGCIILVAMSAIDTIASNTLSAVSGITSRVTINATGTAYPSLTMGEQASVTTFTASATCNASTYWDVLAWEITGTEIVAPSSVSSPVYSSNVPWFGLGGTAVAATHAPVLMEYSAAGTFTFNIPSWMMAGNHFDIVILGPGGGGGGGNGLLYGQGGSPGVWNNGGSAITLVYGTAFPTTTTTISVTVGAGGAGGVATYGNGSAGASGTGVTITGYGSFTTTGGAGGFSASGSYQGFGPSPQNLVYNGNTYYGTYEQQVSGSTGGTPGGGGSGGSYNYQGGAGGPGAVWILCYQ